MFLSGRGIIQINTVDVGSGDYVVVVGGADPNGKTQNGNGVRAKVNSKLF